MLQQLFKGGNYSKEETINYWEVLTAETIQKRKVFKGGNYFYGHTQADPPSRPHPGRTGCMIPRAIKNVKKPPESNV